MIISTTSDGRWQGDLRAMHKFGNELPSRRLALTLARRHTVTARLERLRPTVQTAEVRTVNVTRSEGHT